MLKLSHLFLCSVLSLVVISTALAGSTTQPANPPVKQPIPKDWVKVENKAYHYFFFVPKKWEKSVVNDTQAAYFLPAAQNKKKPLFLLVGGACHETTVEAEAATTRQDLTGGPADLKITKDQASTLGGQPAWSFMAEGITPQTLPPTAPGEKPKIIKHKTKIFRVISVQGNVIYSITFEADDSAFSSNLTNVQRVIDSFAWVPTDPKP